MRQAGIKFDDEETLVVRTANMPGFTLGAGFNQHTGKVVDYGWSIFSDEQLSAAIVSTSAGAKGNTMNISSSYSRNDRGSMLDISGAISIELTAADISGAAEFIRATTVDHLTARLSLNLKAMTETKTVSNGAIHQPTYLDDLKTKTDVTHIITGVQLGTYSIFDFSKSATNTSELTSIAGKLCLNVKSIHLIIQGSGNYTNFNKTEAAEFSCQYNGDLIVSNPPLTMDAAIQTAIEINQKSADPKNSIIVTAFMMPTSAFNDQFSKIANQIEENILSKVTERMALFDKMKTTGGDLLLTSAHGLFAELSTMSIMYEQGRSSIVLSFETAVLSLFPAVRNGTMPMDIFGENVEKLCYPSSSSLTVANMQLYIEDRVNEAKVMEPVLDTGLFLTMGEFMPLMADPNVDFVVALKTNLFCGADEFLLCMVNGCNKTGLQPTTWVNGPVGSTLTVRYGAFHHLMDYNEQMQPMPSQRVKFAIHESLPCTNMTPDVTIEMYTAGVLAIADTSYLAGRPFPYQSSGNNCPPLIKWYPSDAPTSSDVVLTYYVSQRANATSPWVNSTVLASSARPLAGYRQVDVIVQAVCNYITGKGDPLQLFCGPASELMTLNFPEAVSFVQRSPCIYGNCQPDIKVDTLRASGKAIASSCAEWRLRGQTKSGMYTIYDGLHEGAVQLYCHMDADDPTGGWTVIQRVNDHTSFMRQWDDYEKGFTGAADGDVTNSSFWVGNEYIYGQTASTSYKLRVDVESCDGTTASAVYEQFSISCSINNYLLHVSQSASGTAGDAFNMGGAESQNGRPFSTLDKDNDAAAGNCAMQNYGAWWYSTCGYSNGNGPYTYPYCNSDSEHGMHWRSFTNQQPLKSFTMMMQM